MKKSFLLGAALSLTLSTPFAMAEDFHALSQLTALTPLADTQLSSVEGGQLCVNLALVAGVQSNTCIPINTVTLNQQNFAAGTVFTAQINSARIRIRN
jgi:hypothetical protein